jgi:hypothetical protein
MVSLLLGQLYGNTVDMRLFHVIRWETVIPNSFMKTELFGNTCSFESEDFLKRRRFGLVWKSEKVFKNADVMSTIIYVAKVLL